MLVFGERERERDWKYHVVAVRYVMVPFVLAFTAYLDEVEELPAFFSFVPWRGTPRFFPLAGFLEYGYTNWRGIIYMLYVGR